MVFIGFLIVEQINLFGILKTNSYIVIINNKVNKTMKKLITIIILIFTLTNAYSTEPSDTLHSFYIDSTGQIKLTEYDIDFLQQLIFKKYNEYRVKNGLNTCEWFEDTINGSYQHSKHMAEKDINNEGKLFHGKDYMENCLYMSGPGGFIEIYDNGDTISEIDFFSETYDWYATKILQIWINSKLHNENLLWKHNTHFEVGVFIKEEYTKGYKEASYICFDNGVCILMKDSHYYHKRKCYTLYVTARFY